MSRIVSITAMLAISSAAAAVPAAASYPEDPPEHILMLGNSLTRGVPRMLRKLFDARGLDVTVKGRSPNGWTLRTHLLSYPTHRTIAKRPWDIIVMQEQSDGIWYERYPEARALEYLIQDNGSAAMFFMTWRPRGALPSAYDDLRGVPGGDEGYVPIAFELGAPVAPAGWAFRNAVVADDSTDLWKGARHANARGRYLTACVFYATIMGQSPVGILWFPGKIDAADALSLQRLAAETVMAEPGDWNIALP